MAFTTPSTWVAGEVLTAAQLNQQVRDNTNALFPLGADWDSWVPTLTNLTLGNGTVVAEYMQVGGTVFFRFKFTLGSTSAVGTEPTFSAPVDANAAYDSSTTIGQVRPTDADNVDWSGVCHFTTVDTIRMRYINGSSNEAAITATAPFTWTTGDILSATGFYQAA